MSALNDVRCYSFEAHLQKVASVDSAKREIVELQKSVEGVEVVNKGVVEKNFDVAFALCNEFQFWMPALSLLTDALLTQYPNVVPDGVPAARRAWAKYECTKQRMLVAHSYRMCSRSGSSNSIQINMLTTLWKKSKDLPEQDNDDKLPDYIAQSDSDDVIQIESGDDGEDQCPFPDLVQKCAGLPVVDVRLQGERSKKWSLKERQAILRGETPAKKNGKKAAAKKKGKKAAAKKAADKRAAIRQAADEEALVVTPKKPTKTCEMPTPEKVEAQWTAVEKHERGKFHFFQLRRGKQTGGQVSITAGIDWKTAKAVSTFMCALLNFGWSIDGTKEAKKMLLQRKVVMAFGQEFTLDRVVAEASAA